MNKTFMSIPKLDEKDFREWRSKVRMGTSCYNKRLFGVLNGNSCLEGDTNATAIEQWNSDHCDPFSILFFATTRSANILVRQFAGKRQGEGLGDGISAWLAHVDKYDSYTKETRRACYKDLTTHRRKHAKDPKYFFFRMANLWVRLKDMGEVFSDERFEVIILLAITTDYDYVRHTSFRERDFGLQGNKVDNEEHVHRQFVSLFDQAHRGQGSGHAHG